MTKAVLPLMVFLFCLLDISFQACTTGHWGKTCTESCPNNCKTCVSDSNCTECYPGYYTINCAWRCGKGCVNNTCSQSGKCSCKSNNFQTGVCSSCITGKHGRDCNENCPRNCGSCISTTKCGWCKNNRYYGSHCQFSCSVGCSPVACKQEDGNCSKCAIGFTGNKCDSCISGKHGINCNLDCPENCTVCSSNTNCTECKPGVYGSTCTKMCPYGCKDSVCDTDGICIHGCKTGLNTTFNCEMCAPGNWGDSCQYKCPGKCISCTSNETCTQCVDGYYGPTCTAECPIFCLGSICKFDGECFACKEHHFGLNCQLECSNRCLNSNCSWFNGHCIECPQGLYGEYCNSTKCNEGFYGTNCKKECNGRDGNCISCLTNELGMYGGCIKCTRGNYPYIISGQNYAVCTHCPKECKNSTCNSSNGSCIEGCETSTKYGNYCSQNCSENCKNQTCDWKTGECLGGCVKNHYGRFCEHMCASTCEPLNGKSTCNDSNGHCISSCVDGFRGDKCDKKCSDKCFNTTCIQTTAQCLYGCIEGYVGFDCTEEIKGPRLGDDSLIVIIGAAASAGVAIIILGVVLAFCFFKRRRKDTDTNGRSDVDGSLKCLQGDGKTSVLQAEDADAAAVYAQANKPKRKIVEEGSPDYATTYDTEYQKTLKGNSEPDTFRADIETSPYTDPQKTKRTISDEKNEFYDTTYDNKNKKILKGDDNYDVMSPDSNRFPDIERNRQNKHNHMMFDETNAVYDTTSDNKNIKIVYTNNDYDVLSADNEIFPGAGKKTPNQTIIEETSVVYDTTNGNKNKNMFNVTNDYDAISAADIPDTDKDKSETATYAQPNKPKRKIVEKINAAYDSTYDN